MTISVTILGIHLLYYIDFDVVIHRVVLTLIYLAMPNKVLYHVLVFDSSLFYRQLVMGHFGMSQNCSNPQNSPEVMVSVQCLAS